MRSGRSVIARSIASIFSSKSAHRSPPPPRRKRFAFESLESRILLSADPAAASLLVIDGAIEDHSDILAQFSGSDVLVLDQGSDGLEQISQALAERSGDLSELHIVSHGWNGSLALGASTLDAASLESHQAQLRAWADALTADADILFYGCNVAADDAGIGFVEELSRLTGADIAASTDLTGSADQGGDWELEYATGSIEAGAIAGSGDFILATVNYTAATGTLTFTADVGDADVVTITGPAANTLRIVVAVTDAIVLTGDVGSGFTLSGTNTLTITDTTAAGTPISLFGVSLLDLNDSFSFSNNQTHANGLGSVSIDGGTGNDTFSFLNNQLNVLGSVSILGGDDNDTLTLNTTRVGGNLTLGTEAVTVTAGAGVDAGTNVINAAGAGVSFNAGATVAAQTFSAGSLSIVSLSAGIVTLTAATTAGALSLGGNATLSGSGDVTVSGLTTWSGGTMSGTGDTNANGDLTINGTGTKTLSGGRTLNTAGITTWTGSTTNNQSEISFSGGSVINNNGTWNDENGFIVRLNNSGAGNEFNNNGTYNRSGLTGETQISVAFNNASSGPGTGVVNVDAGRLVLGGGGTSSGSFSGAGTLELSGGTHTLTAASSITTANATFSADNGLGTFNINGAYDISDSGTTQVTGSTVNFLAPAADLGATLSVSGGTANLGTTSDALTTLSVSGSGTLTSNGTLTVSGASTLAGSGTIQGSGTLTANGAFTWSSGEMAGTGTTNANGDLNINTSGQKQLSGGRTLNTAGTTTWSGSTSNNTNEIIVTGGSDIVNSGTWNDQNAHLVRLVGSTGGGSFTNNGTYTRSGLTGETQISVAFNNASSGPGTGVVNVDAGRLVLGGGGTSSGSFSGAGTLELSGGTHTLTAASSITTANATFSADNGLGTFNINGAYDISDSGTTQVTGSTVNFLAPAADLGATLSVSGGTANLGTTSDALTTLSVSGSGTLTSNGTLTVSGASTLAGSGTIQGSGTLTANGAFTWSSGEMAGTGTTNANGDLNINTSGQKQLSGGRTLNTAGTTTWSGSTSNNTNEIIVTGGSDIVNSGTWNDQNAHLVRLVGSTGGGSFTNNGTYTRSGLTGETQISVAFNNASSGPGTGVVNVDAGRLVLGGGGTSSGSFSGAGTLELSGGTHTLTAASSITTANATFSADNGLGTFNINGAYDISDSGTTQVTGSTVNFNVAAADLGAVLLVSGGTANLGTTSDALTTLSVSGSGTLTSNGTLTVSGASTLAGSGTIQGSGTLTANGAFTWSSGEMAGTGTTNASGDLNINTSGQKQLSGGRTLNTAGTTTWSGSTSNNTNEIIVTGGSDIVNSGTWNDQNAHLVRLVGSTGGGSFTNNGTYTRSGLTGETQISVAFNNTTSGPGTGVVNVDAGRLVLGGGGTSSGSFSGAGTLELSGGTHTLTATSSITTANATFSSDNTTGTFNINGAYDISDSGTTQVTGSTVNFLAPAADLGATLSVSGGTANLGTTSDALTTLSVSGSGTLTSNGTLTVSGASTLAGSGTIQGSGTLTANGAFTWSSGEMAGTGTTNANGDLNINTSGQKQLSGGRTLNTAGTTTWSGSTSNFSGEILVSNGSAINNNGTWNDQHGFTVRLSNSGSGNVFNNNGTYTKSGAGETQINTGFSNTSTGVVNVNAGTLNLAGGGTHTGSFATVVGTTLEFSGGTHNLNNASAVDSLGRLLISGGTVNTTGTLNTGGLLQMTNGTLNAGGTIDATTYSQSGGTLTGVGTLNVSGLSTWSAGTMSGTGTTNANGDLNINTAGQKRLEGGRTLNTAGTTTWSGSTGGNTNEIIVQGGSIINNSGTWNDQNAHIVRIVNNGGVGNAFNNSGTYTRSAATGETQISVAFNNAGVLNANGGTLSLDGGGTSSGAFNLAGGVLEFGGGVHELQAASSVSGLGSTVRFDNGTVNVAGTYNVTGATSVTGATANFTGTIDAVGALAISIGNANFSSGELIQASTLNLSGGTLSGSDTVSVTGLSTWSAGTMSGTGTTNANGDLNINTAGQKRLEGGRTLNTAGTTTWSGSTGGNTNEIIVQGGSIINNSGTWNDQNAHIVRILNNGGVGNEFNNSGTYTRSGATGETQISVAFNNSGTLNIQAGTLNLSGSVAQTGTITIASGATLFKASGGLSNNGGVISGSGTIDLNTGTLTSSGTILPGGLGSAGVLSLEGNLALNLGSVINFELLSGTQYDAIHITGNASLTGTANIFHLGTPPFVPTVVDAFQVILITPSTSGNVTGTFTTVNPPPPPPVFTYATVYGTDDVTFHLADNEPPEAANDTYTTAEDTELTIAAALGVLANDTDPDLDSLTATVEVGPAHGTLVLNLDGSFTYTPALNFNGTDSFTYRASDGPLSDVATVSLTITPVNDAPVANNDSVTTNEDFAVTVFVRSNDTDVDGDPLTVDQFTQGANGTVTLQASGNLVYTPTANFFGTDTFTYRVRDTGLLVSNTATVTVTVAPVADFSLAFVTPTNGVGEGGGTAALTLVLTTDTALNSNVTVDLTAPGSGSAILGADYTFANPTTLTFLAGSVTGAAQSAAVVITNERSVETVVETADFNFGNISVAGLGVNAGPTTGSHTLSITDNDSAAVAITAPGTTSVTEGGGSANVGVTLTLTTDGTGTEQLDVEVLANLPGNGDYAATAALFGVGAMNGATADVVVTAVNDRNVEQATESFAGQALSVTSTASVSASTSQTINVMDNDSAAVVITTPGTTSVTEGGGSANVGVTLMLTTDGTVGTAQLDVAVAANLPGNADYAATAAVFGVGSISGDTADVVVTAVNDRNVEQSTESFAGQALSVASLASASASTSQTINVTDNDSASVAITAPGTTSVTEGGATANVGVTLTLTTDGVGAEQLDVELVATLPGNADYAATAAVFGVGAISGDAADMVVTAVNDRRVEQVTESFAGQALSVTSTASASASTSQTIDVVDNDSASVAITSPGTTSVIEGRGAATVGVTLTLTTDGTVGTEQLDVAVAANLPGNGDYAASGVVFGVGAISGATAGVVVTAVNDRNVEQATESFAGQALSVTSTASASASTSQTINVLDNDSAAVVITTPDTTSVSEGGGSASVGVALMLTTNGTVGTAQLDVAVAANLLGNADYAATGVVFGIGAISGDAADIAVTAVNDRNVEQATESFAGQALSVTSTANASASTSQTIEVTDNDSASVAISAPGTTRVTEGGASANVGVTLLLTTDGIGTEQLDVAVAAALPGNDDYAAMGAVFAVGAVSGATADVVVSAVNDVMVERAVESFAGQALSVGSTANVSASTSQTIEIADNDTAVYTINDVTVSEADGTLTFTISLSNPVDIEVAIDVSYADQTATGAAGGVGADYDNDLDQVVFAALDMSDKQVTVAITDDSIVEVAETFLASLSTATALGGRSIDVSDTGIGTIANDDANNAPVAVDDTYTTNEDMQLLVSAPGILGNDTDADLDALTAQLVTGPAHGTLIFGSDGSFVYTPDLNFFGSDTFAYRVSDGVLSDDGVVTITVNAVNDAPDAQDDTYTTDEDVALTIAVPGVLLNDTDVDSTLTAVLATGPANGTLVLNADGSFTYTPNLNFNGTDSFSYRASDGSLSDLATVLLTVNAVNDAPDAQDDTYTIDEDTVLTVSVPGVLANDTDVDSATLNAVLGTGPANGTLVLNADGSFTYTPNLNFNGTDSFSYRASDGPLSDLATVLLTVNAVNDAPVAVADAFATDEDTVLTVTMPGLLTNDTDVDSALTAILETGPANGTLVLNADGSFTYTPNLNFNGSDSFTYKADDGDLDSDIATVTLTVNAVNDAPDAQDDTYATDEDTVLTVSVPGVLANDTDVDSTLTVILETGPAHGTLVFNADGSFTYTPNLNFNGTDSFTYRASDGPESDLATVLLTVNAVNDAPDAQDDTYTALEDVVLMVNAPGVLGNDSDVDSTLIAAVVDDVDHGTLSLAADGSFLYLADLNFFGTDTFIYEVSDGQGGTDTATVTITVEAVNDPVLAVDDGATTAEDTAVSVPVVANDQDADGDMLFVTDVGLAANGTVTFSGGAVIYTPNANFHGTDTFEYTVSDGEDIDTGVVTVTVTPVNDAPVAVDDMATTDENVAATIAVLANDQDVDGDGLIVGSVTQGTNGTVTINTDGTVRYTPNAGFFGTDLFEYTVSDGQGETDTGLVTVTVDRADDNHAPVFVEVADRTITEGQEVRFTIVATDADDPAGSLVYSVTSGLPAGATFNAATREFVWIPADEEGNEVTTLRFTVLDPDGATDTMDVVLTVTNAKPTVDAGANQVVGLQKVDDDHGHGDDDDDDCRGHDHGHDHGHRKGEAEVSIKATFNDLGTLDTHTATIDWGDGKVTAGSVSESPFTPGSTAGANGTVAGTHTYKKAGVYTVKVTVMDDDGAMRSDTLTITVKDPDKHLKARDDEYKLREDGVLQVNVAHGVLKNDRAPGSAPLTARLVEGSDHGALVFNADGSFTYRPDANFHGEDSFWYEFTDGTNVSKAVKVELDVKSDGRREACIDWGGHGGWHGGHHGGGQHSNFVEFLIKLARKLD